MANFTFDSHAADRKVGFIQHHCRHTIGQWAGRPFILEDWQRDDIIRPIFGRMGPDGTRLIREAFIFLPRKQGKSTLLAAVILALLCADSEPGAEIYGAAGSRDQSALIYRQVKRMVEMDPMLRKRCKVHETSKTISVPLTGSFYRAISSDADFSHGYNAHAVVVDELHVLRGGKGREFVEVLQTSQGARRQPLMFYITTAGYDRNSICYELFDYAVKQNQGIVDDPTFFNFMRYATDEDDWKSEDTWKKINPALGVYRSMDEMRRTFKKALENPAQENAFRRLYLNQWTEQATRWLSMEAWDATAGIVSEDRFHGRYSYCGVDLSSTCDITAAVHAFPSKDGDDLKIEILPRFFIPEDNIRDRARKDKVPYDKWVKQGLMIATPGNVVDYRYIRKALNEDREKWQVREIAYDRWNSSQFVQELQEDNNTVVPFAQTYAMMSPAMREMETLVHSKRLIHGGNQVLRWMASNLAVDIDHNGNLKPSKKRSMEKIDGMVALCMAIQRAVLHERSGHSIYRDRGLLVI